jgi:CheY-like chemotaxis protein
MADIVAERHRDALGVLLIGFEPVEAARLTAALTQAGRPAYRAADGRVAAELLATAPIGVALADLEGSFNEVLGAIEAVRASRVQRPLLGVGSLEAGAAMTDALQVLGFEGFVPSDVSPQELVFSLNAALYPERRMASRRVPTDLPASFDGIDGPTEGRILNISSTGLFLAAADHWTVTVRFALAPGAAPIAATCRVVWANPGGDGQRYFQGMGLEFVQLRPEASAAIQAFLDQAKAGLDGRPAG